MSWVGKAIGAAVVAGCLASSVALLKKTVVNAVPFTEAQTATETPVQIMGSPVKGTMRYDSGAHRLCFSMRDTQGVVMPIVYPGPKPDDLDTAMTQAAKIGATGVYSPSQHAFVADTLLVKCPSKYQGGAAVERTYKNS